MEPAKYLLNGTLEDFLKIKCSKNEQPHGSNCVQHDCSNACKMIFM